MVGLEGKGAALYFGALGRSLDPAWRFEGRKRHPPPDPINAMLSFGYTVLYHHVSTALVIHGLHPKIGVMHRGRGEHLALASDLMEEFRHLIDALVFATVRRGEIRVDGFRETGGVGPCLMSPEVRQGFVAKLEKRFLTTHSGRDETLSYLATIDRQARLFRETVIGRAPAYQPFRVGEAPERRKDGSVSPVSDGEQEGYGIS
jgi:CRISPR-associated protein Cas1